MRDECCIRYVPASVVITADPPKNGTWVIHLHASEESLEHGKISSWTKKNHEQRKFHIDIYTSYAHDIVPELHNIIRTLAFGDCEDNLTLFINEEGSFVTASIRLIHDCLLQVDILAERGQQNGGSSEIRLLVDRKNFVEQLSGAYCSFGKNGGWLQEDFWDGYHDRVPDEEDRAAVFRSSTVQ